MKVLVKVYNDIKYDPKSEKSGEATYNDVVSYEVKEMTDTEIYALGFDEIDECGEYLILTFADGETATFRNSYTDLFKV